MEQRVEVIKCDRCGREVKYTTVSVYAQTRFLLNEGDEHYKEPGLHPGWRTVARKVDVGHGRFIVACAECLKEGGMRWHG